MDVFQIAAAVAGIDEVVGKARAVVAVADATRGLGAVFVSRRSEAVRRLRLGVVDSCVGRGFSGPCEPREEPSPLWLLVGRHRNV